MSLTRLYDGRVLAAGGIDVSQIVSEDGADLFDPLTSTFSPLTPMNVARVTHSATLLRDGSVLIAGGRFTSSAPTYLTASAERFIAPGIQGPVGPQGPKGDTGATGPQGSQGLTGATGPQGSKGDTGAAGPQGPQGVKGDTGAVGPQGPQGFKGDTGAVGPQGSQGLTGATGPQGAKGDTGTTGPQGPQGVTGDIGAVGPQGSQGPRGDTGAQGIQGLVGPIGPQGPAGPGLVSGSFLFLTDGVAAPSGYAYFGSYAIELKSAGSAKNVHLNFNVYQRQ